MEGHRSRWSELLELVTEKQLAGWSCLSVLLWRVGGAYCVGDHCPMLAVWASSQRQEGAWLVRRRFLVSELCDWNSLSLTKWHLLSAFFLSTRKWHQALHPVDWAAAKAVREGGVGPWQRGWLLWLWELAGAAHAAKVWKSFCFLFSCGC